LAVVLMQTDTTWEIPMRTVVLITLTGLAVAGLTCPSAAQSAYDYPWCGLRGDRGGGQSCYFATREQCETTLSGIGGVCIQNPGYRGPGPLVR
jgi:Protein of unknown function (DUF3551)